MTEIVRTALLLNELRRGSHRPHAALRDLQGRWLRAAVAYAYQFVPFYRRVWDAAGFDPTSVHNIDDLTRLPIIDGGLVREAIESRELFTRAIDAAACPRFPTSGTSGRAKLVPRGPEEARTWRAAGLRTLQEHGIRLWQRAAQFDAPPTRVHFLQRLQLAGTTWIPALLPLDQQLARLVAARAAVVIGTPTVLRRIGRAIAERNLRPLRPQLVVCQGEVLDAGSRAAVHKTFGTDPIDLYGLTEVGYVAWQCEVRGALHVNAELVALEVVGEGKPAAGELGRVVVTDLRGRTMPLLRYDTGDLARATTGPCPCGRTLPTLTPIEGRQSRTVSGPNGRRVTTRTIVNSLAGILAPDDFRLVEDFGQRFRLQVSRDVAGAAERGISGGPDSVVSRAVGRLRELLDPVEVQIEVAEFPQEGTKTDVVRRL